MKTRFLYLTLVCTALLLSIPAQGLAKDTWINVRSKNFFLIGNASEKEIRQVATKLEQFRETFRLLFPRAKFNQTIQTNVVVFKSDSAYRPFKPKRADGKPDDGIAGYFQPGEDLNYITLSTEGEKEDTYGTIFHEYVHFLLDTNFGKSEVPPWFNEGLAEYYQTFQIKEDQKVYLGNLQDNHLLLLQQNKLIPLKDFFQIDNYSLHQNGNHSRSIFYAQAWALIHYLIQANNGANAGNMNKFLNLVMNKVEPEKAFQQTFQFDYATMEKTLKKYVEQRSFTGTLVNLPQKLTFDAEMKTVPLSEAEADAYLGDLLYHTHEYENAETYLQKAVALNANSSIANTSLGLVKMHQRKFDDAKKFLEKAMTDDQKNYLAHFNYAYILSRESMDEFGYVGKFPPDSLKKMRESLQKTMEINPNFTESYRLLGFINLVSNENLDESLVFLKKGLALQPGNQDYAFLIAQIYMRQEKYTEAKELAQKIVKTADEPQLRTNAQNLLDSINRFEESKAFYQKQQQQNDSGNQENRPQILVRRTSKPLSEAELKKINEENEINNLNRSIEKPKADEKQVVGHIEKVSCIKGEINYSVKTETESFPLTSKDFTDLSLNAMVEEAQNIEFGCDSDIKEFLAVITYRPNNDAKAKSKGTLLALNFVPKYFRMKTDEELAKSQQVIVEQEEEPTTETQNVPNKTDFDERRREAMLRAISENLRKPLDGEKRELGIVEKIECSGKTFVFNVKTAVQTLKLKANSPQDVKIMSFTPDASQMRFGCGVTFPPISTVITYRPSNNPKDKQNGDLISLEFVPKSFKLE
jgi:tetratricopeptide (TPR) repeat protein